jgi:glutamate---cysteine ligase / carboxylate-amine ligase
VRDARLPALVPSCRIAHRRANPAQLRSAFERSTPLGVIVEESLVLVDPATFEPTPLADLVLARAGDDPRFVRARLPTELRLATPMTNDAHAAGIALAEARLALARHLGSSASFAATGSHPFASPVRRSSPSRPRRASAGAGCVGLGAPLLRLRVHIAIGGADRALAVFNALRGSLPEITALAANAPFVEGRDTGFASARRALTKTYLLERVPPAFESWARLVDFVRCTHAADVVNDEPKNDCDLRLNACRGTLELRAPDTQTRIEDVIAITALVHGLVAVLVDEYDERGALPWYQSARIAENARRASRDGLAGQMLDLDTGASQSTRVRLGHLIDRVHDRSSVLGNAGALLHTRALVACNGAERQRDMTRTLGRHGLLRLARWLTTETRVSAENLLDSTTLDRSSPRSWG